MAKQKRIKLTANRTISEELITPQYIKVPDKPLLYNSKTDNIIEVPTLVRGQVNTISEAFKYCFDIIDGNIPSCKHVKMACERFIKQYNKPPDGFKFYPEKINHFLLFANQLVHSKGARFNELALILSPWQVLIVCMCYGFYRPELREDGKTIYRRMAQTVFVHIPRKNGKSVMTSVIGLYELAYGEAGSEVYSLATQRDQAKIVYDAAASFISTGPQHVKALFVVDSRKIQKSGDIGSKFISLARDSGKKNDGLNPSIALIDEAAAIVNPKDIEVLQSGLGARETAMMIYLTSGGHNKDTKFFKELQAYRTMLEGIAEDNYRIQGLAYTLDDPTLWDNELGWKMACPNLDISVSKQSYMDDVATLRLIPSGMNEFFCKKLNIYTTNETNWLSTDCYEDPKNITPDDNYTVPEESFIGLDLSAVSDLTAVVRLNRTYENGDVNRPIYTYSYKYFYPQASYNKIPTHLQNIYHDAVVKGDLILQPGRSINQLAIAQYILSEYNSRPFFSVAYDRWNISSIKEELLNKVRMVDVPQGLRLSNWSKAFQMAYYENRIKHVDSPFTQWQLGNCTIYTDANDNIKVRKGDDKNNRVDGILASISALKAALENQAPTDYSGLSLSVDLF